MRFSPPADSVWVAVLGLGLSAVFIAGLGLSAGGCGLTLREPTAIEERDHQSGADVARLAQLKERADAERDEFSAQFEAGMAHMRATLAGDLRQRDAAEVYLERAWRIDPRERPTARILARFLNMRSTALDFSKVGLQVELYESIHPAEVDPVGAPLHAFARDCFLEVARATEAYQDGSTLIAYRRVARLESRLERRLRHHPDDIDTHAMAGNYALAFADLLPLGRQRRLTDGIEHLETQQAHWAELTPAARNENVAPNVRTVWAFMLAEAKTAAGDVEGAASVYERVIADERIDSRPSLALADVSRERLSHLGEYAGREELLPIWPAGPVSCIACHSEKAELPMTDLFVLERRVPPGNDAALGNGAH